MENIDEYKYGQQDFNLPHDVVQLPSGGIFYPSKKKSVKVGYLTAADENVIANMGGKKSVKEVWYDHDTKITLFFLLRK